MDRLKQYLSDTGESLIKKGADALGFDDARQIAISQEAVELTNQMVDAGLIDKRARVELILPREGEINRQNTGIKGDEEIFNIVNHALLSYYAGQHKNPLAGLGVQAKEHFQAIQQNMRGKDPRTEYLDYANNEFGLELARQGLTPEEAKNAIIDNIANVDNQGTRGRMLQGLPFELGKDILQSRGHTPKSIYPWFNKEDANGG